MQFAHDPESTPPWRRRLDFAVGLAVLSVGYLATLAAINSVIHDLVWR